VIPWCEAKVPIPVIIQGVEHPAGALVVCQAPAIASYTYYCAVCHYQGTRSVCAEHDPVPGQVGCAACHDRGQEHPLTWTIAELARQT
jgi:hypothetical protein